MSDVNSLECYAETLLAAAAEAVATTDAGAIDTQVVSPGVPAIDCVPWLSVHVVSIVPDLSAIRAPQTPGHPFPTGQVLLASMVVTVARCVPTIQTPGGLPSAAEITAVAVETNQDLWAIWNHLYWLASDGSLFNAPCQAIYFDPPAPLSIEGQAAGWTIPVRAQINGYTPLASS